MSRELTRVAVTAARELLIAAEKFRDTILILGDVDDVEARELFGCTFLKMGEILRKTKSPLDGR